jgi:adenosine deaminase
VFDDMAKHTLKALLDQGVAVMINSDDPAYFGGYVNANYLAILEALNLTDAECYTLLKNSLEASFVTNAERLAMVAKLDAYWHNWHAAA